MIRIIDTYEKMDSLFEGGCFDLEKWRIYMDDIYENCADKFIGEMTAYFNTGKYTYEDDFLPIINAVYKNPKLEQLHESFCSALSGLEEKIREKFGRELDVDVVLYIGLCNAAGWVTNINGRDTVLLGVEKIIELDWCDIDSMYGLLYHELGHAYHQKYGELEPHCADHRRAFVWQLFSEGIAMYFEQMLVGDPDYFHQDRDGWKAWCDEHYAEIKKDFDRDLGTVSTFDQRFFGDWCDYRGKSDVGYYLGARFVHYLLGEHVFDEMLNYDSEYVYKLYRRFIGENSR